MNIREYKLFKNKDGCPEIKIKREFEYHTNVIETPEELYDIMDSMFSLGEYFVEHNYLVVYDSNRKLIGIVELSHGDSSKVVVPIKELFMSALLLGAYEIVTIHNHPNELLEASLEDIEVKDLIYKCCNLLDIRYLDNMIFSRNGYLSFVEEDLM